jgi:hypothetical protein
LAGGISQTAFRIGDVVVKLAQDPAENEWSAAVFDAIEEDGFRVHRPIRASDGSFLVDNWIAWHWIAGEHERSDWRAAAQAARCLHRAIPAAAARAGRDTRPAWLAGRTHRWARAEAVVWHGAALPAEADYSVPEVALWERARDAGPVLTAEEERESQIVHGDVASNILRDPAFDTLAFIDMSPGWRPASSVDAQVIVEGVAFYGGDEALLDDVASAPGGRAAVARACAFRVLCGLQAVALGATFTPDEVARFTRVLDAVDA